jgi:hypothetical protein
MAAATNKPTEGPPPSALDKAKTEQDALDELEKSRARVAELEKELGVTAVGSATGPGPVRAQVQALLRERAGYLRRAQNPDIREAMESRVSQVDEQLALRGYRVGKDLEKNTADAFEAAGPGVRVEDAITEREARQTVR